MTDWTERMVATFKAAADLSAKQYHFVRVSAAQTVNQASEAVSQQNFGVLINKPAAADAAAAVCYFGETPVVAGGSLTVNVLITTNGSGRAAAAGSGDTVMGRALTAAGANGEQIRALVFPPWKNQGLA